MDRQVFHQQNVIKIVAEETICNHAFLHFVLPCQLYHDYYPATFP